MTTHSSVDHTVAPTLVVLILLPFLGSASWYFRRYTSVHCKLEAHEAGNSVTVAELHDAHALGTSRE